MESIRNLFLNYFVALCIPLTLPEICRIKSPTIYLFVQQLIHADIKRSHYWLSVRALVTVGFPQRRMFELNSVKSSPNLTYLCCYSVSDRYGAFISANPTLKCNFAIVLIPPNKHCYTDSDLTLFCNLVHGIPLMKSSKEDGFRFGRGTIGHQCIPLTENQQRVFIYFLLLV